MATAVIPTERFDNLAKQAVSRVFMDMVAEQLVFERSANLIVDEGSDLFSRLPREGSGFFTIAVGFVGDVSGKMVLILPNAAAEAFTLKLFGAKSLDWIGENPRETMLDTMGELGNMLVGLVKGGLTKWYPKLMLTTPKVFEGRRLKIDPRSLHFRRQYLFAGLGSKMLFDLCCE